MRAFLHAVHTLPRAAPQPAHTRLRSRPQPIRAMSALWTADTGELINLGKGHPNPRFLPLREVQAGFEAAAARPDARSVLQYGRMQGNAELCKRIAEWIAASAPGRSNLPKEEQILVTTGSGPGLALVTQLFSTPGDVVIIDSPGYFLAFYSFVDAMLEVVPVQTDAHGLDVDKVEEAIKQGVRPKLVYTVPIANNPTGVGMSDERKEKLVKLAREHGFKIIADEVYSFLTFGSEETPKSLFEYDDPSDPVVLSISSFSKILGPGLRVGWIAAHEPLISRILKCGSLMSGGGFNPFTSAVVLEMMESGFVDKQVRLLREEYAKTCEVLCESIDEFMASAMRPGEKLRYEKPEGGFFCFVTLPERFDCEKLLDVAKEHGVSYFAGRHSSPDKKGFANSLRFCFAFVDADVIREGVRRVAEAMKAY